MVDKKDFSGLLVLIVVGAILGFVVGWVVWFLFGRIQLFLGVDFPYCAMHGPPLVYQIAWTVFGPIGLIFFLGKK